MYLPKSTCRVCLIKGENLMSIFDDTDSIPVSSKFRVCLNYEITLNDSLPSVICGSCLDDLDTSYKFVLRCQQSEEVLKEYLNVLEKCGYDANEIFVKEDYDEDSSNHANWYSDDTKIDFCDGEIKHEQPIEKIFVSTSKRKKGSKKNRKLKKRTKHSHQTASETDLKCSQCGLVAICKSALVIHNRKHTGEKPFSCSHCEKTFSRKGTMKMHIQRRHLNKRTKDESGYACEVCGKCFIRRRDLKIHFRLHTGERPYMCPVCSMTFTQVGALIRHKRTHSGERPYTCEKCGKSFADKSMVKMHQSVHSNERKYSCDLCGKCVKSKITLIRHLSYHSNLKLNVCHECGAAFSTKGNLKVHMTKLHTERSDTGENGFQCDFCQKSFLKKSSYANHMNKHINRNKFICEVDDCKLGFSLRSMLEFHILKYHKNITPFVCTFCERGFYRTGDLSKHIKQHHNKH